MICSYICRTLFTHNKLQLSFRTTIDYTSGSCSIVTSSHLEYKCKYYRDICTQLCIYAFRCLQIVVYGMGKCPVSVVISCGKVNWVCDCVVVFVMFLVYFQDNEYEIIPCPFKFIWLQVYWGDDCACVVTMPCENVCQVIECCDVVKLDIASEYLVLSVVMVYIKMFYSQVSYIIIG